MGQESELAPITKSRNSQNATTHTQKNTPQHSQKEINYYKELEKKTKNYIYIIVVKNRTKSLIFLRTKIILTSVRSCSPFTISPRTRRGVGGVLTTLGTSLSEGERGYSLNRVFLPKPKPKNETLVQPKALRPTNA